MRRILVVGAHAVLRYGRQNLKNIPGSRNCWRDDPKAEWVKSNQKRPMSEECQRAKIRPLISFHGLRHTCGQYGRRSANGGGAQLGHADTRMVEKHYGHLAPSYIADAIRAGAPRFRIAAPTNVRPLAR